MTDEIWQWSAVEVAKAIRHGSISSQEAVASTLARINEVNPAVNALTEVSAESALAAAGAADAKQRRGDFLGLLHGVPLTTKINTDQAGFATTNGVAAFKDNVVEHDAPHIENLRTAGAILLGRSNAPAFAMRWFTDNALHGETLNPWDSTRTPGGSSGGAAVAVATGMSAISQGNDLAGSVRYPAACCGVVGIRPTPGRVPHWYGPWHEDQVLGVQLMGVEGPLARSVGDVELGLRAMAMPSARDPFFVPAPLDGPPLPGGRRVAILRDVGVSSLDPAVDSAISTAGGWLEDAGFEVEEVRLPLFAEAWQIWRVLIHGIEFGRLEPAVKQYGDEIIRRAVDYKFAVTRPLHSESLLDDYVRGYARRGTLMRELQLFQQEFPVILTPISTEKPFEVDADIKNLSRLEQVIAAQWPMLAVSLLGVPGLSVPVTQAEGVPIGIQLVGQRFREDTLFEVGRVIEARNQVRTPMNP